MKKIISLKLVAALMMTLVPLLSLATSGQITYTATYNGDVTLGTRILGGVTYTTVAYEGLDNAGNPGKPSLPVDFISFSVPYNATNFTITATPVLKETLQLNYPVCPIQVHTSSVTQPDNMTYSLVVYPSAAAHYEKEGMLAGENHIITVAVYPVSFWNGNSLKVYSAVNLTVNYDLSDSPAIKPLIRRDSTLRSKGFEQTCDVVSNPSEVRGNAVPQRFANQFNSLIPEDTVSNPLTYLIVTTQNMIGPLRRLIALRNQKGMKVKTVTVTEAVNDSLAGNGDDINWNGIITDSDDAGKLRQYLRMHYVYYGTEYVLLAGSEVPSRVLRGGNSDFYFSELTGDFLFITNSYGQLFVGRLLGKSPYQFDNYIDKLYRYELNPGNGDLSYLNRALFIEGFDLETYGPTDTGVPFTDCTFFNHVSHPDEWTGNEIINLINNNHYGFLSTYNTGFPSATRIYHNYNNNTSHYIWAIDSIKIAPNITDNESGNGLNRLSNKLYPMINLSGFGMTIPYDSVPGYNVKLNYGESFTMGKDYGGPAFFGYSGEVDFFEASKMARAIVRSMNSNSILGQLELRAKYVLHPLDDEKALCCHNLLGDPAIEIWTNQPMHYSNITVNRYDNSVTVSGINASSTTVAYHSNDGTTGSVIASGDAVTLNVSPNSTIMLYKHNYIPYIAPLVLQNTILENSQYVIASDVIAGKSVDSGRSYGDVTVKDGAEYEIEASGRVILNSGFKVEKGGAFSVHKACFKN